jgi:hypothetical protein
MHEMKYIKSGKISNNIYKLSELIKKVYLFFLKSQSRFNQFNLFFNL